MLHVGSDGKGRWINHLFRPLLERTFPHTKIVFNEEGAEPNLVIRSHFSAQESLNYSCPYISWSGESYRVRPKDYAPLFELNTAHHAVENNVYLPHIVAEIPHTTKPVISEAAAIPRKYCAAYAFSNPVRERERLFTFMRKCEPKCYSFGRSMSTADNPFALSMSQRGENGTAFRDFAFVVAMENKVAPGYLTEKIGYAFMNGAVPIYWGDSETVSDIFNPAGYLDVNSYGGPERAAMAAIGIWRDPQKLMPFLEAPLCLNYRLADYEAIYTEYRPWQKPMVDALRDAFPDLS
jgi:hypothetical protein